MTALGSSQTPFRKKFAVSDVLLCSLTEVSAMGEVEGPHGRFN